MLGIGQNFGEDEVIQKETVRKSRVVVKSLAAEVLVIPLEVTFSILNQLLIGFFYRKFLPRSRLKKINRKIL